MTFVIVLISVLLERFVTQVEKFRVWTCLPKYSAFLDKKFGKNKSWKGYVRLAAIVLPWVIVVAIIEGVLSANDLTGLQFIFNLIVLVYCVGPKSFYAPFKSLISTKVSAPEKESEEESEDEEQVAAAESEGMAVAEVVEDFDAKASLVAVNTMIFAALFWFVILGPIGAALYRLCAENQLGDDAAKVVTKVLDWIPARLFAFTYGLIGNFVAVIPVWLTKVISSWDQNDAILQECAEKALGESEEDLPLKTQALVDRALIVWLVVLALVVLL